jgi:hypothetical protein
MYKAFTPFAHIDFSSKIKAIYNPFANCIMLLLTEVRPLSLLSVTTHYVTADSRG